jgi:MYXO-CTERM domain-containing protein
MAGIMPASGGEMSNRGAVWRRVMGGIALAGLMRASAVQAEDWYWVGGSGDWNTPENWSRFALAPGGDGVPLQGQDVYLQALGMEEREIAITSATGHLPEAGSVFVAGGVGGLVTLRIEPGAADFRASLIDMGSSGVGRVVQVGGAVSTDAVQMGVFDKGVASYSLGGGRLDAGWVVLNGNGTALSTMTQTGGALAAGIVSMRGAGAAYQLSDGGVVSGEMSFDGGAAFTQTGGSVSVRRLTNSGGDYRWLGGELAVETYWDLHGAMTFPESPVTMNVNGRIEFGQSDLTNARNVSLHVGAGSVVSRPADFDPAVTFGAYENAGLDHVVGTALTVPAGREVRTAGTFSDPVEVIGSIGPAGAAFELNFEGGLTLRSGGSAKASAVSAWGVTSTIEGGTLKTGMLRVTGTAGFPGNPSDRRVGRIDQSGGAVTAAYFQVASVGEAEYHLSGGELLTDDATIGPWRSPYSLLVETLPGVFRQTGGSYRAGLLRLGVGGSAEGTYVLSAGALVAGELIVGDSMDEPWIKRRTWGVGRFHFDGAEAGMTVTSSMVIGPRGEFTAVPGAVLRLQGASLSVLGADLQRVSGFDVLRVVFEAPETPVEGGVTESRLEVASEDRGASLAGFVDNFVIDTLQVGGEGAARVRLVDEAYNQLGAVRDAIYVRHLILNEGSVLDLGGRQLYALDFLNAGGSVQSSGGQMMVVPEPGVMGAAGMALFLRRRRRRVGRRGMPH